MKNQNAFVKKAPVTVSSARYLRFQMPACEVRDQEVMIHVMYGDGADGPDTIGIQVYGQVNDGGCLYQLVSTIFPKKPDEDEQEQIVHFLNDNERFSQRLDELLNFLDENLVRGIGAKPTAKKKGRGGNRGDKQGPGHYS